MVLKDILSGMVSPQIQGMQPQGFMPQQMMPQMQSQQPVMTDMYGQQQGGLRQALMGRLYNGRL